LVDLFSMPGKGKTSTAPRGSIKVRGGLLARGIELYPRSKSYKKKGKWAVKNKRPVVKTDTAKPPVVKSLKNGQTRTIREKTPRWYPTEDVKHPLPSRKANANERRANNAKLAPETKLRSSLTPGTVVILLAGRFRGKRAVFLKQLQSGLLLVSGPYKVNGIPLRRVNQAYVIATSTRVDVDSILKTDAKTGKVDFADPKLREKFNDKYFAKKDKKKSKKTEGELFAAEPEKSKVDPAKVEDQKLVDGSLLKLVDKVPELRDYLAARFTLSHGDYPHDIKF